MITCYTVKDEKGNVVVEGDINTVIAKTGLSKADIYGMVKGGQLGLTAEAQKITRFSTKKVKEIKQDDIVTYVEKHLALYGNTVLSKQVSESEVKKIKSQLAKKGIALDYQYKRYAEGYGGWLLTELKSS